MMVMVMIVMNDNGNSGDHSRGVYNGGGGGGRVLCVAKSKCSVLYRIV